VITWPKPLDAPLMKMTSKDGGEARGSIADAPTAADIIEIQF
jgi:hypothetical protein